MNRTLVLTALAAGLATSTLATSALLAQTPAAPAAAPAAPPAAVAPQAIPAKIAVIALGAGMEATNEAQKAAADVQKKYQPKKAALDAQAAEIESLQKQAQALPATISDEERAKRLRDIDVKQKAYQRDTEDAQTAYSGDINEALGKILQKFGGMAVKYAQDNGFTLLLNDGQSQQQLPTILWAAQATDITEAVVNAYNVASGVPAPPPPTPSAPKPRPTTAPKPATKP